MFQVPLRTIFENLRSRGWAIVQRTLQRDRLDSAYRRSRPGASAQLPGSLQGVEPLRCGQRFHFQNCQLELEFLDPAIARFTWLPGTPTPPYALARTHWPEVDIQTREEHGVHYLESSELRIAVHTNGEVHWFAAAPSGWVLLRRDQPPLRSGEGWQAAFAARPEQAFFGLGEQAGPFNLRGQVRRCWNTDPGGSYAPGADPIYMPIPIYLSLHADGAYLIFYENPFPSEFNFAQRDATVQVSFEAGQLRGYLIPGPPQRCLERYTELTGRAPLPPLWSLGLHQSRWGYRNETDIRQVAEGYRQHRLPLSAIHLDIDYMHGYRVFTVDEQRFPNLPALSSELSTAGVRLVTILDPGVKADPTYPVYQDGLSQGSFASLDGSTPYLGAVWPGTSAFPDFTSPAVRRWWGSYYPRLLEAGIAGFWHDMNEPTNFMAWGDLTLPLAVKHDLDGQGGDHRQAHNLYALQMNRAGYEALRSLRPQQRPWLLSRSGWAGQQRYAWNWTGDTETSWPVLRMTIATVLGLGLSGFPFSGPDIGGFSGSPDAELMLRWFQLATLLPFFRIHSAAGTARREPWTFGEPAITIMRHMIHLRQRLLPYLYTLAWQASQTGAPLVRPLWWEFPQEALTTGKPDCFLLGDSLLVAPVLEKGASSRSIHLPQGEWIDFWSEQRLCGPAEFELDAPLKRLPILVRAGALLPCEPQPGAIELHFYPASTPDANLHAGLLYSDAGDGYGAHRLDRFDARPSPGNQLHLSWKTEGDYPLPGDHLPFIVHGAALARASLDGAGMTIQNNTFHLPALASGQRLLTLYYGNP